MKKMKFFVGALAALTMFASCSNETGGMEVKDTLLTVKIASSGLNTKAGGPVDPATEVATTLETGVIFLLVGDEIKNAIQIVKSDINGPGQKIADVPSNSTVYIVGNIPDATITKWVTNAAAGDRPADITALNNELLSILSDNDNGYLFDDATLANASATPAIISVSGNEASVKVSISPVYTRFELAKVTGIETDADNKINGFKVEGIYMDNVSLNYSVGGKNDGTIKTNGAEKDPVKILANLHADLADVNPYTAVAEGTSFSANPGAPKVWGFNIPCHTSAPRVIIRLTDVDYTKGGAPFTGETKFLTVTTFKEKNGTEIKSFLRGNVYRITGLQFKESDLADTPNAKGVELTVEVDIVKWIINEIDGEF